jgi:hypothetical protein
MMSLRSCAGSLTKSDTPSLLYRIYYRRLTRFPDRLTRRRAQVRSVQGE